MKVIENEHRRTQLAALAALLKDVPENRRDIVAAQIIGTINGAVIAAQIDLEQKSA